MSNREKLLWAAYGCVLVLLFLMSSTDLIIKEKEAQIYPVSVIIRQSSDEYYENFRRGVDQAAMDFHADVNFITLYNANDQAQQQELLQRELRDGTRAVILEPVQTDEMTMELEALRPGCPVIVVGGTAAGEFITDVVTGDHYEAGRLLGEAVAADVPSELPVYLLSEGLSYGGNAELYDGVSSVLSQKGYQITLVERRDEDTCREVIEGTVYPETGRAAVVALDVQTLDEASAVLEGSTVYREHVTALYGAGCTTAILNRLDQGSIDGIVVFNQYNEGYLSVKRAVEAVRGARQRVQPELEPVYLDRERMGWKQYEKMLYPIG